MTSNSIFARIGRRNLTILLLLGCIGLIVLGTVYLPRIIPRLLVPDYKDLPVNTAGYEIQPLPETFVAVCLHSNDIYYGKTDGRLYRIAESEIGQPAREIPSPLKEPPRLLFVSQSGHLYVSGSRPPTYRSIDLGKTWTPVIDVSGWRMAEMEPGVLAMGNYPGRGADSKTGLGATVYLSRDDGIAWTPYELSSKSFHIHTLRWDTEEHRLYVAFGDAADRGEGYLSGPELKLTLTGSGKGHGHTDVAILRDCIIWGSDDQTGRILKRSRTGGPEETLMGWSQYIWWVTGQETQVYLGTMPGKLQGGEKAVILASSDQGKTWQKLLEARVSRKAYDHGWHADSRILSPEGWIYFSNDETAYRVRKKP